MPVWSLSFLIFKMMGNYLPGRWWVSNRQAHGTLMGLILGKSLIIFFSVHPTILTSLTPLSGPWLEAGSTSPGGSRLFTSAKESPATTHLGPVAQSPGEDWTARMLQVRVARTHPCLFSSWWSLFPFWCLPLSPLPQSLDPASDFGNRDRTESKLKFREHGCTAANTL